MTNTIDWGEFQGSTGDWQKFRFDNPGDAISGTLVSIRVATMADGTRMPALEIRDSEGTEWSLLAGAVNLQPNYYKSADITANRSTQKRRLR
jgi:hypothetical protein